MKKKVLIMSIPHTGTVFTIDYLDQVMPLKYLGDDHWKFIKHPSKHVAGQFHISITQRKESEEYWTKEYNIMEYAKDNCKVIIPLRHPIENAISYTARYGVGNYMDELVDNWRIMIELHSNYDVFWLDINITRAKRHNMMRQLNKFIEREPIDRIKFYRYVKQWKPLNVYRENSNLIKDAYIEQGKLPVGYDFRSLDFAVWWYNKKKIELEQQYSRPK